MRGAKQHQQQHEPTVVASQILLPETEEFSYGRLLL
jgi:hypothetical protein